MQINFGTTQTTKRPGSVRIEGYEGTTTIWPGKAVYYYPNSTSIHGMGSARSNSYGSAVPAEVVKITAKKVTIRITGEYGNKSKEITVCHYRVCSNSNSYWG
jgi:hypothetical protein